MVRVAKLCPCWRKRAMERETNPVGDTRALASDVMSSDHAPDDLAIFSAPAVEVVNHWWAECNKRWAERDRLKGIPGARG